MTKTQKTWIIGCGKFGKQALDILVQRQPPDSLLAVDSDPGALAHAKSLQVPVMEADGTVLLADRLEGDIGPEWIIPCVPFHLSLQLLIRHSLARRPGLRASIIPVPKGFSEKIPNPTSADSGGFYTTFAEFTCPPNCPEPGDQCTYTGKKRLGRLYAHLADQTWPGYRVLVLRSRQLGPGLGGYRRADLLELEKKTFLGQGRILVATACSCHGVVHGLMIS